MFRRTCFKCRFHSKRLVTGLILGCLLIGYFCFYDKEFAGFTLEPIYAQERSIKYISGGANVTERFTFPQSSIHESVTSRLTTKVKEIVEKRVYNDITSFADYIPVDFIGSDDGKYNFSSSIKAAGNGFTLIIMFNLFTGQEIDGYSEETLDSLIIRNSEYLSVIRENINHSQIKKVVMLYTDENSLKVIGRQNWPNITKIYPFKMERLIHMSDFFNISSKYLLDEPVIGTNGDIVIGENFEDIDTERLRDTKTLYTLTRHGNKGIGDCEAKSMCLMKYYGSHDTHIFRLKEPIPDETLKILNYPVNLQQAENGMIAMMLKIGFHVFNPCPVLTTYHIHCSRIGKRLLKGANSIRNQPWGVKLIKTCKPTNKLKYG